VTQFDDVYAAHRDAVWRYFRRRSAADHEDLTTEVFLVAWRRRDEMPDEPLPWLYGVARKVLANHRRADGRRDALAARAAAHAASAAPDLAEAVGVRTDLARALAELPERDRELILLVAWEGLTLAEAAAALGCRRGAAAVRLHRARRRLHAALHDEGGSTLTPMTALEER
jgi:RNA polymerase sigma-70 factor (ECF subfamily)